MTFIVEVDAHGNVSLWRRRTRKFRRYIMHEEPDGTLILAPVHETADNSRDSR